MEERSHLSLRLADGRRLAYAEWGSREGVPVFFFHGIPGGRLTRYGQDALLEERDVRLITPDRPGIGFSDAATERSVAQWADDLGELADHLGLDRFPVVAFSAGSAFALACAARFQHRVSAVALVSPSGPLDKPGFVDDMATARYMKLARRAPWAMAAMYGTVARRGRKHPHSAHEMFFRGSSRADREVLDRPAVKARWMAAYLAATEKRGGRGLVEDMRVIQRPWGFDPGQASVPVHVWSGEADRIAPRRHAEYWVETLPGCRPIWCAAEGHFLIEDRIGEVLDAVGHPASGAR